jgi:peroxiredoxin
MKLFGRKKTDQNQQSNGADDAQKTWPTSALTPGTPAPAFSLPATTADSLSLSDFLGRPVVLVFFPADWSPTCSDQLALYSEAIELFEEFKAQILAISVDGIWCHRAYSDARSFKFPLLSDFEPKGAVARAYGVYDEEKGRCQRALFVIDEEGVIRWSYVSPANVNPGANGILNALETI